MFLSNIRNTEEYKIIKKHKKQSSGEITFSEQWKQRIFGPKEFNTELAGTKENWNILQKDK